MWLQGKLARVRSQEAGVSLSLFVFCCSVVVAVLTLACVPACLRVHLCGPPCHPFSCQSYFLGVALVSLAGTSSPSLFRCRPRPFVLRRFFSQQQYCSKFETLPDCRTRCCALQLCSPSRKTSDPFVLSDSSRALLVSVRSDNHQQRLFGSSGRSPRSCEQHLCRSRCLGRRRRRIGESVYRRLEWARVCVGCGLSGGTQRGRGRRRRSHHTGLYAYGAGTGLGAAEAVVVVGGEGGGGDVGRVVALCCWFCGFKFAILIQNLIYIFLLSGARPTTT